MTVQLGRRGFMRALAAAPVAARSLAHSLTANAANLVAPTAARMAGLSASVQGGVPAHGGHWLLTNHPRLMALHKLGLLPKWAKQQIIHEAGYARRGTIDANVAALRSVSLSAKVFINDRRFERKVWANLDDGLSMDLARAAFFEEEHGSASTEARP